MCRCAVSFPAHQGKWHNETLWFLKRKMIWSLIVWIWKAERGQWFLVLTVGREKDQSWPRASRWGPSGNGCARNYKSSALDWAQPKVRRAVVFSNQLFLVVAKRENICPSRCEYPERKWGEQLVPGAAPLMATRTCAPCRPCPGNTPTQGEVV